MSAEGTSATPLEFQPLTRDRWNDLEQLFGQRGAYGGCWCMWWRTSRSQFEKQGNEGNREAMKAIVGSGQVPGILAYLDEQPIGWCSVAPRETYASLNRSHVLKRLDDKPVWSIVCFYIAKAHRGQNLTLELIRGAIDYVRQQGGKIVEAYPTQPSSDGRLPPG